MTLQSNRQNHWECGFIIRWGFVIINQFFPWTNIWNHFWMIFQLREKITKMIHDFYEYQNECLHQAHFVVIVVIFFIYVFLQILSFFFSFFNFVIQNKMTITTTIIAYEFGYMYHILYGTILSLRWCWCLFYEHSADAIRILMQCCCCCNYFCLFVVKHLTREHAFI